jgi:hypothetical protein
MASGVDEEQAQEQARQAQEQARKAHNLWAAAARGDGAAMQRLLGVDPDGL